MLRPVLLRTLLAATLFAASCNSEEPNGESEKVEIKYARSENTDPAASVDTPNDEKVVDTPKTPVVDSFEVQMDSLMKANIKLPPVYQREIFTANEEAAGKFSDLAKLTKGKVKVVVNSATVVSELVGTIKQASALDADMLILIDRTGSMGDDIDYVKKGASQIIDSIKKYKGTRLAIATYGDKNWDKWCPWFTLKNFEKNYDSALMHLQRLEVVGNEDWPESVYDAVMECLKSDFWRSTKKRTLILIGDAPPQEKPMSEYTLQDVINKSRESKMKMNFYPILITPDIRKVILSAEDMNKYKVTQNNTKLFPNPSNGIINLSMEKTSTYYLELYNAAGEIVMNEEYFGVYWTKDISHLPNGMYIMRVIAQDHTYEMIKMILQH